MLFASIHIPCRTRGFDLKITMSVEQDESYDDCLVKRGLLNAVPHARPGTNPSAVFDLWLSSRGKRQPREVTARNVTKFKRAKAIHAGTGIPKKRAPPDRGVIATLSKADQTRGSQFFRMPRDSNP